MALSVILTINSINHDVADYVMKDSIIIDEGLFNEKDLKPTTNKASFTLSRACPYIDEIFAWTDSIPLAISLDGALSFTGYLTDNHSLTIGTTGAQEVKIDAEDPGIRKLKIAWTSTDGLSTIFNGDKVCDPADTGNSFLHILAGLAGVTLAASLPTITTPLYFTVKDSDSKDYWGILSDVLFEAKYVFYFNAAGEMALFSLAGLTGGTTQAVSTSAEVLAKNGDVGIKVTKRLLTYKQVDVKFNEAETLASAVIFRDTTGQTAINDCNIEMAGGAYYPSTCDASTYAYFDYFLEDGRKILAVGSAASDFVVDSGITSEFLNVGLSARVRFLNTLGITADIRKLKINGSNVIAVKAESKVIAGESAKFKKEYEAKYLTSKTDATELANLLYYFYKNSSSTYKWRSYMGTLYPSETLFPSTTLYPMGDLIALGELIDLKDPVFSGLDVDVAVTRRKYTLGRFGADYEGIGIGTITLANPVGYVPTAPAIVPGPKYLATKPLAADPLGATPDTADFVGQYGVYGSQRYVCTALPSTWELDDAGQTVADVAALVPIYEPAYLGAHLDAAPSTHKNGDSYLRYSATSGVDNRGVFVSDGSTFTRTTDPIYVYKALADIVFICQLKDTDGTTALYGAEADYGIDSSMQTAHIMSAIIDRLRVGDLEIFGTLKSKLLDTINPQTGETINAPTPTYWPGSELIDLCSTLADGWHAVDSASTLDSKNITHAVKGGSDNTVSYQASDAEVTGTSTTKTLIKSITSAVTGKVRVYFDYYGLRSLLYLEKGLGGGLITVIGENAYTTYFVDIEITAGDVLYLYIAVIFPGDTGYVKNFRVCPAPDTIGLWNNTNDTAISIDNAGYYDEAGTVNVNSGTLTTTSIDDYWEGSELIALFTGKVSAYRTIDLGGGTFNSKTCDEIYYTPTYLKITYTDATDNEIYSDQFYTYTGSIILNDVEGKILLGNPDSEGQYELWSHNIPGTTNNILTVRNIKSGKVYSIWETRAPDTTAGKDSESTFSLHGVVGTADYVHDHSMHNYSGDMHFIDGFYNYGGDHVGDWKKVAKRTLTAWAPDTAYTVDELRQNGGNAYICTSAGISASSGGPSGTSNHILDNTAYWDYLGSVTENVWESLIAEHYSSSGSLWLCGGRKPTGYLHGTYTQAEVFNALVPALRTSGQYILVTGSIYNNTATLNISRAVRNSSYGIDLYGINLSTATAATQYISGSTGTSLVVSLAW